MAIPKIPQFEDLLSSFTRLNPQNENYESLLVSPAQHARMPNGSLVVNKPVIIWYRKDLQLTIDATLKRLRSELINIKHRSSDEIVKAILLLFTFHPKQKTDSVDSINEILEMQVSSEVSQFFILSASSTDGFIPVHFGDFSLTTLDAKRFAYKCERANSDFFSLYQDLLVNKPCIERDRFQTVVINWHYFLEKYLKASVSEFLDNARYYFEAMSRGLFDDFWFDFREQQNLHIACGLAVINEKYFKERQFSQFVSIFLKIDVNGRNRGYVVPLQLGTFVMSMSRDLASSIKRFYDKLNKDYSFSLFGPNEIHQTIKTFSLFIAKGYRYLEEDKKDDGFLHFVIALDLVFGDRNESTKTVSNRCALLTYEKMNRKYTEQKKILAEIYDLRSKYVHQGISIKERYIEEVKPICEEIMYCFFRVQKNSAHSLEQVTIDRWKKNLDFAWSALEAGKPITGEIRAEIGMAS